MFGQGTSHSIGLFLKMWALLFAAIGGIAYFYTGLSKILFYAFIGSFGTTVPLFLLISWAGDSGGSLFLGSRSKITNRERLAGELDKARFSISKGNYREALQVINAVLKVEPDFCNALIIKAECEIKEGRTMLAKKTLKHLSNVCQHDEIVMRWGEELLSEVEKS